MKWVLIHRDCVIFRYDLYMMHIHCLGVHACIFLGYHKLNLFCETEVLIDDCGEYLFMICDTV
jgi:hypothetical protein